MNEQDREMENGPPTGSGEAGTTPPETAESPRAGVPAPQGAEPAWRHRRALPPDVYTPWGWLDVFLLLLVALGAIAVLGIVAELGAILVFHMSMAAFLKFAQTSGEFNAILSGIWELLVVGFLFARIRWGRGVLFRKTIGWRNFRPSAMPLGAKYALGILGGMALAVVVGIASKAFPTKQSLPIEGLLHSRTGILWIMAVGVLLAPALEETIFRGYIYPVLARSWGVWGGILGTGFLFGLMHAHQLWGGWGQIALLAFVGIVLTYARARTGTVLTSWLLHTGYNGFLFALFFISTGGLHHLPPAS